VISGNAQRLIRTEADMERADALRAIVRQAHRISGILRDLMQFARPPQPLTRVFPLGDLLHGAREDLATFANEREVQLDLEGIYTGLWVHGDLTQLRHALGSVIRNGIEAATSGGWVRVSCPRTDDSVFRIIVEDSGTGLSPEIAQHAFDPFFCGRTAGRGRGLGLSTAWQLARQNGGELRYEPTESGPTRFVLTLHKGEANPDVLPLRSA
jgi:two-component system NtrC family sensor kinase